MEICIWKNSKKLAHMLKNCKKKSDGMRIDYEYSLYLITVVGEKTRPKVQINIHYAYPHKAQQTRLGKTF